MPTRFAHTNLIARDWRRLASFYESVFGCTLVPPERDLSGSWLDRATGIRGAEIRGAHLRLPGCGADGPTLEIYEYREMPDRPRSVPNMPGFSHIAFAVDDVAQTARRVFEAGGEAVGELAEVEVPGAGSLVFQYVADPEGNIVELQRWS